MALTDITQIVKINVTNAAVTFSLENYLRKNVLISGGDTIKGKLAVGGYVELNSSNYNQYLKEDSRSSLYARSFFSFAGNTSLGLLEVGEPKDVSITEQCATVKSFIELEEHKSYGYIVPEYWFIPKERIYTEQWAISSPKEVDISTLTDGGDGILVDFTTNFDSVEVTAIDNSLEFSTATRLISLKGGQTLPKTPTELKLTGKSVLGPEAEIAISLIPQTLFSLSSTANKIDISKLIEAGGNNDTGDKVEEIVVDFTSTFEKGVGFEIVYAENEANKDGLTFSVADKKLTLQNGKTLPTEAVTLKLKGSNNSNTLTGEISISLELQTPVDVEEVKSEATLTISTTATQNGSEFQHQNAKDYGFQKLATEYSGDDKRVVFFVEAPYPETPEVIEAERLYEGLKAVQIVCNTISNTNLALVGVVAGKTASSYFDIDTDNPASPLNFKAVSGVNPLNLSLPAKKQLIQNCITFADSVGGNSVLMNGRQMDTKPWEYYYNFYLVENALKSKLALLILNGVNNPTSAVKYDQSGIDTLKANIVSVLSTYVSYGCLTAFAEGYDANTGELTGTNSIKAPEFYAYIAANPENYKNEIIGGFSMYLQIGQFVRQVEIDITKS